MTWVGLGGSYVQETTYKYVGMGAGDFELKGSAPNRLPVLICVGLVVVLLIVLLVFLAIPPTTTTMKNINILRPQLDFRAPKNALCSLLVVWLCSGWFVTWPRLC
jgi:hypothetical protein